MTFVRPQPRAPRRGAAALLPLALVSIVAVLGLLTATIWRHTPPPPPPDPVIVYGPEQYDGIGGIKQTYIEQINISGADPTRRHVLRVDNGNPDVPAVTDADSAEIWVNGFLTWVTPATAPNGWLELPIPVQGVEDLIICIYGPTGSAMTVSIREEPQTQFVVYGPLEAFADGSPNMVIVVDTFDLPSNAPADYHGVFVSGDPDGTDRITAGWVVINGAEYAQESGSRFLGNGATIALQPTGNIVELWVQGAVGARGRVWFLATDTLSPALTVTVPTQNAIVGATPLNTSGTVVDQTQATVTVNGVAATLNGTAWSKAVALTEGLNTITVVAEDAANAPVTIERSVRLDTQPPSLSVTAPINNRVTRFDTVTVTGTATDVTALTVTANSVPFTLDGGGAFTGTVPLANEGSNLITIAATDAAGNVNTELRTVIRDQTLPTLTVSAPADQSTVSTETVAVSGTVTDATALNLTVNGNALTIGGGGAFSGTAALAVGPNTLSFVATDAAGNQRTVNRSVTRSGSLPPDPASVASVIDSTVPYSLAASTAFLYTGANPIQTGVSPGTIEEVRAAVLRGKVLNGTGQALSGVTVAILGHPELGQTLSRADGWYDLAVNGGDRLTMAYSRSGYLTAHRDVTVPWREFTAMDSVALVALDTAVTTIDFSEPIEVARGVAVADTDGVRRGTAMFRQGTTATMVLPNGSTQNLASMAVRITEYTVGPLGPSRMPAELPPTSAYTYAFELSADEALAAGAREVTFSEPVAYYVENFLDAPVGYAVPLGYYDRRAGKWLPERDGIVIRIASITDSMADLVTDTLGTIADSARLAQIGITDEERYQLALLYDVDETLWRAQVDHFSPFDLNWLFLLEADAVAPSDNGASANRRPDCKSKKAGSIIGCEDGSLGEALPVTGTGMGLHYSSNRQPGYEQAYAVNARTGQGIPQVQSLIEEYYKIVVAGKTDTIRGWPGPALLRRYIWDGQDPYGRNVSSPQLASVQRCFRYRPTGMVSMWGDQRTFGYTGVAVNPGQREVATRTSASTSLCTEPNQMTLGVFRSLGMGLGGWTLSAHHTYDPYTKLLSRGDGEQRSVEATGNTVKLVQALAGSFGTIGGAPIWDRGQPEKAFNGPDGSLYVVYPNEGTTFAGGYLRGVIRRIAPDGNVTIYRDSLSFPQGAAFGPDSALYVAEAGAHRILRIAPNGSRTVVVGTGSAGFSGDGGPASAAQLNGPADLSFGPDGAMYIADLNNNRIRRVARDSTISTFAGTGTLNSFNQVAGIPATEAGFGLVFSVAAAPNGNVYFSASFGSNVYAVFRVDPAGRAWVVAGRSDIPGSPGYGTPATTPAFGQIRQVSITPRGEVLFVTNQVFRLIADYNMEVLAGRPQPRCYFGSGGGCDAFPDNLPSQQAAFTDIAGVAQSPSGRLIINARFDNRVYLVEPGLPTANVTDYVVADEDGGAVHVFTKYGRHLRTQDTRTNATHLSFAYDSAGRLLSIDGPEQNSIEIERNGQGHPTALVAPFGQRTVFTTDGSAQFRTITNPAGEVVRSYARANGLLDSLVNARGQRTRFVFASDGRLLRDFSALNDSVSLVFGLFDDSSSAVEFVSAMGRRTRYTTTFGNSERLIRDTRTPDGITTRWSRAGDKVITMAGPDSTVITVLPGPDPRWGTQAQFPNVMTVRVPSGLTLEVKRTSRATLSTPTNPLSLTTLADTMRINGRIATSLYDAATRRLTNTSPEGRVQIADTDTLGRVTRDSVAGLLATRYSYDSRGRLGQVQSGGRTSTFTYDSLGRLQTSTDPLGRTDSLFYDSADRTTRVALHGGRQVQLAYDSAGNLIGVTPPGKPQHQFSYTAIDLASAYTPPSLGGGTWATQYRYDADRALTHLIRATGDTIRFTYDTAGRPIGVVFDRGTITLNYHPTTGQLSSLLSPGGPEVQYFYDGMLPTRASWSGSVQGSVDFEYDTDFRVNEISVNNANPVSLTYDGDGLLTQVGALTLGRQASNGLLQSDSLGVTGGSWAFDPRGALSSYTARASGSALFAVTHVRDSLGRVTQVTEIVQSDTLVRAYTYDTSGRLNEVREGGTLVRTYGYDGNGNRTSLTGPGLNLTGTYDDQDRMSGYGGATYTYDRHGSLSLKVSGSDSTRYTYDALGNLLKVRLPSGDSVEYVLDGQNRRVARRVNGSVAQKWLWQGQLAPAAELDSNNAVVTRFVYGTRPNVPDYMIRGGVTYRLVLDQLGSVRLVVNASTGAVAQRLDYDEFGRLLTNTDPGFQPFGYAGGMYDDMTGLVRFGVRDYDAVTGRWTAKDPSLFGGRLGSLYSYVGADPVNLIDQTGFSPQSAFSSFVRGLAFGAVGTYVIGVAVTVATVAASPVIATAAAAVAVAATAYGAFQLGQALYELGTASDWASGRALSCEELIDRAAGLAGGLIGGGLVGRGFQLGKEPIRGDGWRVAPFGNRTGNRYGEPPHYHRGRPDPSRPGHNQYDQGTSRHRPWEPRGTDTSFWDRF